MAEILGLGVTHYPGLMAPDDQMAAILERTLASAQVPAELKSPESWPPPMREEYLANRDLSVTREHRRRCLAAFGKVRAALDAFAPDFVLIWGDDQYENFRDDGIPPFCVFALDHIDSRPFRRRSFWKPGNIWEEPEDTVFATKGHAVAGSFIAAGLLRAGFDLSYAYKMRYELGLPHAFINALLLLETRHNAPTIAASAIQQGPNGSYVYVIGADGTVQIRPVTVAQISQGQALIDSGLKGGENVVVDGQYRLQPGTLVQELHGKAAQQADLQSAVEQAIP